MSACVTAGNPVLQRVPALAGPSGPRDGSRTRVLQPPRVPNYSSYRTPPSMRSRWGAAPARGRTLTRLGGVVGVTHLSVRIEDDELEAFRDDRESASETVRTALRYLRAQEQGVDDERLTDDQRAAYQWFRDRVGVGGTMTVGVAKNRLAQHLSQDMDLVKWALLRPLESHGYIRVQSRISTSRITVLPPEAAEEEPRGSAAVDDPEEAGDRLDELAEAETGVSQGAD